MSASWIESDKAKALAYIASKINEALTQDEVTKLSRIAIIDTDNPALEALQRTVDIEHGMAVVEDSVFLGYR